MIYVLKGHFCGVGEAGSAENMISAAEPGKKGSNRERVDLGNLLIDPLDSLVSVAKSSKYQDG